MAHPIFDPAIVVPSAEHPVSLEEAKAQLHVDYQDHDALIDRYIAAAVSHIEGQYELALVTQTLSWQTRYFGSGIELPRTPVQEVVSVEYFAPDETTLTALDVASYIRVGRYIKLASGASWPAIYSRDDAIKVTFVAGFGDAADVPTAIVQAIMLMVGHWYEHRSTVVDGNVMALPFGAAPLLSPYRRAFL